MIGQQPVIAVSEPDLEDLRSRLRGTRWPIAWPGTTWETGTDAGELRRLVEHWGSDYDWRLHEEVINTLSSHVAHIDGCAVHFVRFDGEHPTACRSC